jgi:molybdopterin/thiamine biosynthesis adenylyltransferase
MGSPSSREVSRPQPRRSRTSLNRLRIRTANILLVSIKALATEVAKNLVLAGIGSITLADHEVVTEEDLGAQFFISAADVGKNVSCFKPLYTIIPDSI